MLAIVKEVASRMAVVAPSRATTAACLLSTQASPAAASSTMSSSSSNRTDELVTVLTLNNLSDNAGAVKKKRRVGRGIGSSKGKTSGRGHKGQKSRSGGNIHPSFEGGQTKFYKLLPKRGFNNKNHADEMTPVNLGTLQDYVTMGRLPVDNDGNEDRVLTLKDLVDAGVVHKNVKHGVKLLAKGAERFEAPLKLRVSRASTAAIEAVERAGGEVTTVHYNRLALRALLKPEKFQDKGILPKFARPPPKLMPYYLNWKRNRGYLSPQAQMREVLKQRPELRQAAQNKTDGKQQQQATQEETKE